MKLLNSKVLPQLLSIAFSAAGFITIFIASLLFTKLEFGSVVNVTSSAAFISAVLSFGFVGYFLGRVEIYKAFKVEVMQLPLILTGLAFFISVFFYDFSYVFFAFYSLVMITVFCNMLYLKYQVEMEPIKFVAFQSTPTIIKSFVLMLLFIPMLFMQVGDLVDLYCIFLIVTSISTTICLLIIHWQKSSISKYIGLFKVVFTKNGPLFSWLSVVLSFASFGALPFIISKLNGDEFVAYLGVYFIFWSVVTALSTSLIINRYTYKLSHYIYSSDFIGLRFEYRSIFINSLYIALPLLLMVFLFGVFLSEYVWPKYEGIKDFIVVVSLILPLKCAQTSFGLIATFPPYVKYKFFSQVVSFLSFILLIILQGLKEPLDIVIFLLISDVLLTVCYLIIFLFAYLRFQKNGVWS